MRVFVQAMVRFLASMPFAIAMLALVAISSAIGTILKQQQNYVDYVNRFGGWWTDLFLALGLHQIYSNLWFLLILAFLVLSTSACIVRTFPKLYVWMKKDYPNTRINNIKQQAYFAQIEVNSNNLDDYSKHLSQQLSLKNYRFKQNQLNVDNLDKNSSTQPTLLITAKKFYWQKWGYLLTHLGVVVICLGGLLDSNWWLNYQLFSKQLSTLKPNESWQEKNVAPAHNPSFRASLFVPEGEKNNLATMQMTDGIIAQRLNFDIYLRKFNIEYYPSGMPKKFISYIDVYDKQTSTLKVQNKAIEVNQPLHYDGYTIYQSSFEDGGSQLKLQAYPIFHSNHAAFTAANHSLSNPKPITSLKQHTQMVDVSTQQPANLAAVLNAFNSPASSTTKSLEISEFRANNVEAQINNVSKLDDETANNPEKSNKNSGFSQLLQVQNTQKKFKNLGSSIQYKLRDFSNQAIEFHTYMLALPVNQDNMFVWGMRSKPQDAFKYVYIPAMNGSMDAWHGIYQSLYTRPDIVQQAIKNYVTTSPNVNMHAQLTQAAQKSVQNLLYGGLQSIAQQLSKLDAKTQANTGDVLLRMLHGILWQVWQINQTEQNQAMPAQNAQHSMFIQNSLIAISDIQMLNAPALFKLNGFTEKKASVFQVTKSPGQFWVYLGCIALILGVFMMLFIQEQRLWLLLQNNQLYIGMHAKKNAGMQLLFKELVDDIRKHN